MALVRTTVRPKLATLLTDYFNMHPHALAVCQKEVVHAQSDRGKLARIFDQFPVTMSDKTLQERLQALRAVCDGVQVNENNMLARGSDKGKVETLISRWLLDLIEDTLGQNGQLEPELAALLSWDVALSQHDVYLFLISGLNVMWQTVLHAWDAAQACETEAVPGAQEAMFQQKNATLNAIFLYANAGQVCAWAVNALRATDRIVNEQELNKLHPTDWQQDLLRRIKRPEVATGMVFGVVSLMVAGGIMLFGRSWSEPSDPANKPARSTPP